MHSIRRRLPGRGLDMQLIAYGAAAHEPLDTATATDLHRIVAALVVNAAAKASRINYRTAQRIVEAAAERRQGQLVAAS